MYCCILHVTGQQDPFWTLHWNISNTLPQPIQATESHLSAFNRDTTLCQQVKRTNEEEQTAPNRQTPVIHPETISRELKNKQGTRY
jgi:hypothetical protein